MSMAIGWDIETFTVIPNGEIPDKYVVIVAFIVSAPSGKIEAFRTIVQHDIP